NVLITVQLLDRADQGLFVDGRRILLTQRAYSGLGTGFDLTGDVNGRGWVVADQDDGQPGSDPGFRTQGRDPRLTFEADAGGDLLTIDYLCGHALLITGSGAKSGLGCNDINPGAFPIPVPFLSALNARNRAVRVNSVR